jgi:hypothetical protein
MIVGIGWPRLYHIVEAPELTEAELLRMFWCLYTLGGVAVVAFVADVLIRERDDK